MARRSSRRNRLGLSGISRKRLFQLGSIVAAGAAAGTAQANTIVVNSLADTTVSGDSQCTLREALANANSNSDTTGGDCNSGSGADQITTTTAGTITLAGVQLPITDSVSIDGTGLTINGNAASRIFYVYNNSQTLDVTINHFTLTNGIGGGSAVSNKAENLTLDTDTVTGNNGDAVVTTGGGSLTVLASTVTGTTAGRGIKVDHATSASISGTTLSNNTAGQKGAGAFFYNVGTVTIDTTTVTGNQTTGSRGGGLDFYRTNGAVSITNSQITNNTAANRGGGIHLYRQFGPLTIANTTISGNSAGSRAGGLMLYKIYDDATISNTTISGNTTNNRGGGIFFYKQTAGKTLTITHSTISGNTSNGSFAGGGIFFYKTAGTTILEDTTISGNTAAKGGGLYDFNVPAGALVIRNSTINGNTATVEGGNVALDNFPSVTIIDSIIANGTAPLFPDLKTAATNVTANYSLIEDTTGATFTGANNITGVDPQLGPLANNGGTTLTHLPAVTSPVINAGDPGFAPPPATDQRGGARVVRGRVDIGSVEVNGGSIQFSAPSFPVNEGSGSVTVTITRTGGTDPATVTYATSNGSAVAPADYTATSGTATFAAGATTATFNVPIVDDGIFEGPQFFDVTLNNPSPGAALGPQSVATVPIADNEAPPTLSINSVSQAEGNAGTTPFNFQVTLSSASEATTLVLYATANGTAVAPGDYAPASGLLTFLPGVTTQPIVVSVNGDTTFEVNETFTVNLSSPTNATIATGTGTGTIQNDDPGTADLAITKTAVPAGFFAGVPVTFNINVTNNGPNTANSVVVTDTLPAGATFVSAVPSQGVCSGTTTVTCSLGVIVNGGSATVTLTMTPAAEGPLSNTATVSDAPQPDPNSANDSSTATVTVRPSSQIPVLGPFGTLLLAAATAMVGMFMMRERG